MSKHDSTATGMTKAKSWADVDNDDFFAAVAQDKPASTKASPTATWGSRVAEPAPEKKSATNGGVPWAFPNPVQPQATTQTGTRFDSLSPHTRRSATLGNWRR